MDFEPMPQGRWSVLSDLADSTSELDTKCARILALIKEATQAETLLGQNACHMEISPGQREMATFSSAVGEGRFVRTWNATGERLGANLIFERKLIDTRQREYWEPVFCMTVQRSGGAVMGSGGDAVKIPLGAFDDTSRRGAFTALMAMVYGVIVGPSKGTAQP